MARPRSFDPDETLLQLKALFWADGYDGASMSDIEQATGLNKQSLYRQWGDKRRMYLAALQSYAREEMTQAAKLLSGPGSAFDKIESLFMGAAQTADRRGCFLCNASIDQAQADDETRAAVQAMLSATLQAFKTALGPAHEDKAASFQASYHGLRVMAAAGMSREVLVEVAQGVLARLK
ncbi:MAG: TetR/AcrR family transcriptional regulator [Roseovarius sp.]